MKRFTRKTILSALTSIPTASVAAYAQETNATDLFAVPLLGLFVTSMIVVIVWLMYKDKLEQPK